MEQVEIHFDKASLADRCRNELGIEIGMSKEQALEKFMEWREKEKTCQRCEGDKYVCFCPIHLICEEANLKDEREEVTEYGPGGTIDIGGRPLEEFRLEEAGIG